MKRRRLTIAVLMLLIAMLIPAYAEMDDGGSRQYTAVLYRVTLRHTLIRQAETDGYLTGTEIRILGCEVYNSTQFVPDEGR